MDVIQMLWIGPRLRRIQQLCIQSFLDVGHPVHCYTYGAVDNMPAGVEVLDAATIIPKGDIFTYQTGPGRGSYAAFANLFRYKLLFEHGGWWSDADVFCIKPWRDFGEHVFVREPNSLTHMHNGILRAPAGSKVMAYMYNNAKRQDPATLRWGQTGSRLLTQAYGLFTEFKDNVQPSNVFCPLFWGHMHKLVVAPPKELLTPDVCGVHLFQEMWRRRNVDMEKEQPIFEWLKQQQEVYTDAP